MKRYFRTVVVVCTVVAGTRVYSQWVQTNGPCGGDIRSLAASENAVLAGTYRSGVFLTTDGGTSWATVNSGLTNTTVLSLADCSSVNQLISVTLLCIIGARIFRHNAMVVAGDREIVVPFESKVPPHEMYNCTIQRAQ